MRFDPKQSREQIAETLHREAAATWGADALESLRQTIETTAWAIWTVARERLETTDVEPFGGTR